MAYRIEKNEENTDIVIDGWENGIANNPYGGISDMRNVDPFTIPGEVSIGTSNYPTITNIAVSGASFTVNPATDIFTWAGTTALPVNTAIRFTNSGGALPTGLSATSAYYIKQISGDNTQFYISASGSGTQVDITGAGSGTNTFTVINMGKPTQIVGKGIAQAVYYAVDSNGRVWIYHAGLNNFWIYLNNLASELSTNSLNNIITWKGYLFLLTGVNFGYVAVDNLNVMSLKASWNLTWKSIHSANIHTAIIGQDDIIYYCSDSYVGTLKQNISTTFDPTNAATYTLNDEALDIPSNDKSTCLEELSNFILVGGQGNLVYPWDRISSSFNIPLQLSENYTTKMVTVNSTTYIFAGYRGNIYTTNGSNISEYWKIPDHLSNTVNPYYIWKDAVFNRGKLYFGFAVTDNAGTTINEYGGLWVLDTKTKSGLLKNISSYATYSGYVSALCQFRGTNNANVPSNDGDGLFIGWYSGSIGGIDKGIATPYIGGESYVDTEIIPVGQFLNKKTISDIEFKLSTPLVTGESIALHYRKNITDAFVVVPLTQGGNVGELSGICTPDFENVEWLQIRAYLTGTATSPSYVRLREIRIRING